jgi:fatty acid desaturase
LIVLVLPSPIKETAMTHANTQAKKPVTVFSARAAAAGVGNSDGIKKSLTIATLIAAVFASASAHAGGLSDGTSAVTSFEVWFYALAGIAAICYLVWTGVQCWSNKADWISDFGGAVAKVAAVGSVTVLAPWAWSVFAG